MSHKLLMPALSPSMTDGKIGKWLVKEGVNVTAGEVIAEIETDKATLEFEAPLSGTLIKILIPEGTEGVPVDQPVAILGAEGDAVEGQLAAQAPIEGKVEMTPNQATPELQVTNTVSRQASANPRVSASPLARVLARQHGIDLAGITGTGPGQRIVKTDIEKAKKEIEKNKPTPQSTDATPANDARRNQLTPQPWQKYETLNNNTMRKTIARRLSEAKQHVPHFYLTTSVQMDRVLALRAELNARPAATYKLSVNDFIIKAAAFALHRVPDANVMWTEDAILRFKDVDISVAVSTEGGLVTPVIRNADNKGLQLISDEMKELASRARANKLKPEEYQGGGFSISNLGMFGVEQFSAIINPPQSCILAVGATEKRAVVGEDDAVVVKAMMTMTLSVDHRSVDGALGARLLAETKTALEEPLSMML
ncbi:pyruvate dehydrogenase complex dihydrolipoamide acetyltransferase [Ensifer sp. NM-2]|uniref:pyruvate dehydrogenase complex dihydrolipoamide acetyltransferase n=1 Tax=Ensifer sp. NM-2 TaxID=2109730 RepID=UPI000D12EBE2|nr:pyruvate dehydrogenase complex dihydrolipoamide acetyltransferase [Ensifer sp. NM-2]PSS60519.1 pyruvate dehydrogenase complex dihydrolipoamide acetyltransferase [Ensifer sp. NM-2]